MIVTEAARCFVIFAFAVFNLSVIAYVYKERKRNAKLNTGFYVLFLAVSIADWIELVMVRSTSTSPHLISPHLI
ncbi:hypothetical protein AAVH_15741 [Aphelenchoides avenae]|nr:hypothetical protein AAVH_15741 [Aphelenchus avenae]